MFMNQPNNNAGGQAAQFKDPDVWDPPTPPKNPAKKAASGSNWGAGPRR